MPECFYHYFEQSPVEKIKFLSHEFLIKRDDLLHPDYGGNKARKMYFLFKTDLSKYRQIASYGGHQSNAMLSLAAFARQKNLEFFYFTKTVPKFLRKNPNGNFKRALDLGMKLISTNNYAEITEGKMPDLPPNTLFVKQGLAEPEAEYGIQLLAEEIRNYADKNQLNEMSLVLPSGTGATALYLQKHSCFDVYTVPNAGNTNYLRKQFADLEKSEDFYPNIWDFEDRKYRFGHLYPEFYEIQQKLLQETGIEFELLYDPKTWLLLLRNFSEIKQPVMYIHSGGTYGNRSMLPRYKRYFSLS